MLFLHSFAYPITLLLIIDDELFVFRFVRFNPKVSSYLSLICKKGFIIKPLPEVDGYCNCFVIIINFRNRFNKALTEIFQFRMALVLL